MNVELKDLAARINEREEKIEASFVATMTHAKLTIEMVMDQGEDLAKAKAQRRHGEWGPWLKMYCPKVSDRSARRYMALALNRPRVADLPEGGITSLRVALAIWGMEGKGEQGDEPRRWPAWLEAQGKLSKFLGYVERFDMQAWPAEGVEKLKTDLLPLVQKLWPEGL